MSGEKETAVGDGEDWVEAEIEGELAGLAHLTLEDLEDLEEENNGGYHGNKEAVPSLGEGTTARPEQLNVASIFTQYLSALQVAESDSTELLMEAQQVLADAHRSISTDGVDPNATDLQQLMQQNLNRNETLQNVELSQNVGWREECNHQSEWGCEEGLHEQDGSDRVEGKERGCCIQTGEGASNLLDQREQNKDGMLEGSRLVSQQDRLEESGLVSQEESRLASQEGNRLVSQQKCRLEGRRLEEISLEGGLEGSSVERSRLVSQEESSGVLASQEGISSREERNIGSEGSIEVESTTPVQDEWLELEGEKQRRQEVLDAMILEITRSKREHDALMEERAQREADARALVVTTLQAGVRGWLTRREHGPKLREKRAEVRRKQWLATLLQARARGWLVRQVFSPSLNQQRARRVKLRSGVVLCQAHVRGYLVRKECRVRLQELQERRARERERAKADELDRVVTLLQAASRGCLMRRASRAKVDQQRRFEASVVWIQACCRGHLMRRAHKAALRENQCRRKRAVTEHQKMKLSVMVTSPDVVAKPTSPYTTPTPPVSATIARPTSTYTIPAVSVTAVSDAVAKPTSTYTLPTSPNKPKLTLVRRLQSALKALEPHLPSSPSLPTHLISSATLDLASGSPPSLSLHTHLTDSATPTLELASRSHPVSPPIEHREDNTVDKVSSAPHLLKGETRGDVERVEPAQRSTTGGKKLAGSGDLLAGGDDQEGEGLGERGDSGGMEVAVQRAKGCCRSELVLEGQRKAGVCGDTMDTTVDASESSSSGEMRELVAEEKALQEVVRSRVEELAVAQLARERMSTIFGEEEIKMMAERQRARTTYHNELEHAASPLLPKAWLGLIEDRVDRWKESHTSWKKKSRPAAQRADRSPQDYRTGKASHAECQPLTKGQLLAASNKGTALEDVVQVVVYQSRYVIDLSSLQQCPKLRSATLVRCGLESVTNRIQNYCPQLMELNLPSNEMKQMALGCHGNLCFMDLSDNHLASVQGLGHTPQLLHLNLSGNRMARVAGVTACPLLQGLNLDSNLLINTKGLEDLSDLESLSCCENHLPQVEGLGNCHLLQTLLLAQNNLQQLPSLANHVLLRELNLAENSLSDVTPITEAWLPLLQTLSLANNCISQLFSLAYLIMLQNLDLTSNSLYDLPVLLQSLRGCYRLKRLAVSGNPVTQEKLFRVYLLKAVPSLEVVEEKGVGVGLKCNIGKSRSSVDTLDILTSSNIYMTCLRQIQEQDNLKEIHCQKLQALNEGCLCPEDAEALMQCRVQHCHQYHKLLCQHLKQHEELQAGKWSEPNPARNQTRKWAGLKPGQMEEGKVETRISNAVELRAAVRIQAVWRGLRARRLLVMLRKEKMQQRLHTAAVTIQAWFRGWRLRNRLSQVQKELEQAFHARGEEEFDYEEEIMLDFLDEGILEAGFEAGPLSPDNQDQEVAMAKPSVLFDIPGGSGMEIPYEEWKEAYHEHHPQRGHVATGTPTSASAESGRLVQEPGEGHVLEAWGSSETCLQEQGAGGVVGVAMSGTSEHQKEGEQNKREAIKSEWGFTSDTTAHSMLRRAKRQKRFLSNAAQRKKLADPATRLAQFKKLHNKSSPAILHCSNTSHQSDQPSPTAIHTSSSLEELSAKEHYKWTHSLKLVRQTPPESRTHSSLLPHLEPHVLAGHLPRLVVRKDIADPHSRGLKLADREPNPNFKHKNIEGRQ